MVAVWLWNRYDPRTTSITPRLPIGPGRQAPPWMRGGEVYATGRRQRAYTAAYSPPPPPRRRRPVCPRRDWRPWHIAAGGVVHGKSRLRNQFISQCMLNATGRRRRSRMTLWRRVDRIDFLIDQLNSDVFNLYYNDQNFVDQKFSFVSQTSYFNACKPTVGRFLIKISKISKKNLLKNITYPMFNLLPHWLADMWLSSTVQLVQSGFSCRKKRKKDSYVIAFECR